VRLLKRTLLLLFASAFVVAPDVIAQTDADVAKYELDMDKIRRMMKGAKALMTAAQKDPALGEAMESMASEESFQGHVAQLEKNPRLKAALVSAGTTPREYVMTTFAYAEAAAVGVTLQASSNARMPAEANRKNVEFFMKNRAEIEKMMKDAGMMSPN
jgi:hypothetical protein